MSKDTAFNGERAPRHTFLCSDLQCLPPGDPKILCSKHDYPITGKSFIGQNLTGEFRRKIYTASWNLFTLVAEAVSGLCQFVMLWTVFHHWVYKMKYSCCQVSSVIHGWFAYWVFGWKIRRLSKSEIRFRMVYRFLFLPCVMSKSVEKS